MSLGNSVSGCPFCLIFETGEVETEFVHQWYNVNCIVPRNPSVPGHVIFFHSLHTENVFENFVTTRQVMWKVMEYAASKNENHQIIIQYGEYGEQTVNHLHIHYRPCRPDDGRKSIWR